MTPIEWTAAGIAAAVLYAFGAGVAYSVFGPEDPTCLDTGSDFRPQHRCFGPEMADRVVNRCAACAQLAAARWVAVFWPLVAVGFTLKTVFRVAALPFRATFNLGKRLPS